MHGQRDGVARAAIHFLNAFAAANAGDGVIGFLPQLYDSNIFQLRAGGLKKALDKLNGHRPKRTRRLAQPQGN